MINTLQIRSDNTTANCKLIDMSTYCEHMPMKRTQEETRSHTLIPANTHVGLWGWIFKGESKLFSSIWKSFWLLYLVVAVIRDGKHKHFDRIVNKTTV